MTATPREIDTKLAELFTTAQTAQAGIDAAADSLYRLAGDRGRYVSRSRKVYSITLEAAEAATRQVATGGGYDAERAARLIAGIDAARAEIAAADEAAAPLEAEFAARRWSRFFLVTSSNGHIHRSMDCSTCNIRTAYGWLPELSGKTEADAVAAHGALLCTVCFPSAPVEWTNGRDAKTDGLCPGSRTLSYPRETARLGYASGNYGVCSHCSQAITVTSTGKLKAHKA